MYIDSHAHLDGPKFDSDRDQVLVRAREAGLERILAIGSGTGPGTLDCAIKVASRHDWIYATIGIHPHEAKLATEADYAEMQQLAGNPKVIAWGEIGLDYFYDHSPREVQKEVFRRQMELARTARLPIIIHCRPTNNSENAWDDTLQMLRDHWAPSGLPGILHCFTGEWKHAEAALDIGFYISFAGNISFPKAENIREAAKQVPLERMLIETDSPFLAPVPHRGKRNEPAFVVNTAETIAILRGITPEETGEQTRNNFYRLFPAALPAIPVPQTAG
ncbi:MAG TPA: TatD family hydrolase [Candidatus Angelobacter sp.]|nr:TatD family hydrolase [Candidatus Angelobacter sp.]